MKWLTTPELAFNPLEGIRLGETKEQLKLAALKALNKNILLGLKCALLLEDYDNEPLLADEAWAAEEAP